MLDVRAVARKKVVHRGRFLISVSTIHSAAGPLLSHGGFIAGDAISSGFQSGFVTGGFGEQAQNFKHHGDGHQRGVSRHVEWRRNLNHITTDQVESA